MALTFLTGLAMFGALTFLPLYQQTVQGASPTLSGLMLTPMMLGVTVTSIVAGQVTTRTGRYKVFPILGGAIMGLGMFLLTGLGVDTTKTTSALYYVVLGLGMGFLMQMVSLIAQNSVQQKDMGVASSARMFFQQIGGSLGVAAFGAVFARRLTESLAAAAGTGVHISASGGQLDPATVDSLPAQVKHDVFFAIAHAVQGVFIWALPAAVLIFVLALLIKEVPLRGRAPGRRNRQPAARARVIAGRNPGSSRTGRGDEYHGPFGLKMVLQSAADVGDGFQDLDGVGAAVRQRVGGLLAHLLAHDGGAERRAGRVDVDRRAALLAGGEQEGHLVVVLDEPDGDRHARADHAVGARRARRRGRSPGCAGER